jgi:hypothetical protein
MDANSFLLASDDFSYPRLNEAALRWSTIHLSPGPLPCGRSNDGIDPLCPSPSVMSGQDGTSMIRASGGPWHFRRMRRNRICDCASKMQMHPSAKGYFDEDKDV